MNDFDNSYDHNKSLLYANKLANLEGGDHQSVTPSKIGQEDLRSLRSEYDYKTKKTFTEFVASPSKAQQMSRMRDEHAQGNNAAIENSLKSIKSRMSKVSQKSAAARAQHKQMMEKILEEPAEVPRLVEELVSTLQVCVCCNNSLTKDEKMINARFIQTAVQHD